MRDITPTYSDEEIFVMLELAFGAPPTPIAARYRDDPGFADKKRHEQAYYNEVTTFIMQFRKIAATFELRKMFYLRYDIHIYH